MFFELISEYIDRFMNCADEENMEELKKVLDDFDLLDVTNKIIDHKSEHLEYTALMEASYKGHEALAELLLDRGAKVDVQDDNLKKQTALIIAADKGHETVVELLLPFLIP